MLSESTQQELKEKFAKLASNPDMWLLEARTLFMSASLVAEEVRRRWDDRDPRKPPEETFTIRDEFTPGYFQAVYMLVVGFALENLFKAHLVEKNGGHFRESMARSGKLAKELKTHDLRKLAEQCGLDLDQATTHLLARLTKHAEWKGRYRFPVNFTIFYHLTPQNDMPSSGTGYGSDDVENITRMVRSLCNALGFPDMKRTTP